MTGSAYQTTQYLYGVTTSAGSGLNSNDILSAIRYPEGTTGDPSSSQQESYTVNALGETRTKTTAMAMSTATATTYWGA